LRLRAASHQDAAVRGSAVFPALVITAVAGCGRDAGRASNSDGPRADAAVGSDASLGSDGSIALACPTGSTLIADRTSCSTTVAAPPASLLTTDAQPGDVVSMAGLDEGALPCLPALVCAPGSAATMLFSDDPESPSADGVLYADTFGPGHARVYVYHVNADTSARKFPIVVLDDGATDAHVTITQEGLGGPSSDYVDVGKAVAAAWAASDLATVVTVPAGTRVVLDDDLDALHAATGELVHAIVDVDADAPVKISIVSVLASEDAATVTASLPLLPNDGSHDRGTFPGADMLVVGSAGGEGSSARHVSLGADTFEPDLVGVDATTGSAARLHGNYGVAYRFAIAAVDPLRLAASARGGGWEGVLAGSAAVTPLPTAPGALSTTTDAVWLATLPVGLASFLLMSGGGSSLPVDVVVLTP
jgi:hypothetical protein